MNEGSWSFGKICWVVSGEGHLESNGQYIPFVSGDLLYVPAEAKHCFNDKKGQPSTLAMICFEQEELPPFFKATLDFFINRFTDFRISKVDDPWRRNFCLDHFRKLMIDQERKDFGYQDLIMSRFVEFLVFANRLALQESDTNNQSYRQRMLEGMMSYLQENFHREISLDDCAERCNMSSRSLSRHFKKETGKTIVQYITELRIDYACQLIRETRQITFSALDAGFNDISFFYRIFKRYKGMTPKEYMKLHS
jgi:AraC-like DNA-binding protein